MGIKQAVRSTGLLRFLAACSASILIFGCTAPEGVYRNAYGPEPWGYTPDHPLDFERGTAPSDSVQENRNFPAEGKPPSRVPVENAGRPEPPASRIPGITDIPEIPDEPTILSE
ncbi:MAG: hypothetical protein L0Y38_04800 [Methylococcaceae bacterium]|nr:hypothetical protein [Methylococcaceae bacterium]MCI0733128.1 hypothetical protein [Methylococcaceae bacterium]